MSSTRRWLVALAGFGLAIFTTGAQAAGHHSHARAARVTTATYSPKPTTLHRLHALLLRDGMSADRAGITRG